MSVSGEMKTSLPPLKGRTLPAGICAALMALAFAVGCSSAGRGQSLPPHSHKATRPAVTATVLSWGSFFGGKSGNFDIRTSPEPITLPGKVAEVGSSNAAQYALLTNGTLYAWGLGTQGELGDGGTSNSFSTPVRVRFPAGVKIASIPQDAMPYDTGLAVDTHGHVWGWGHNGGGELCLGTNRAYLTPVELPFSHVSALAGASNHALYDAGGTVWTCGHNIAGDLGDGTRHNTMRPVRVAGLSGQHVTELVASFANSGALLANGRYYDWGDNGHGQLGVGRIGHSSDVPVLVRLRAPVIRVAEGGSLWNNGQTMVILADGSLWAWGDDWAGQLGNGKQVTKPSPVHIHPPHGVTYRRLATGSDTSYAVSTTGKVYAWGASHVGQVGDGLTTTTLKPVRVVTGATSISSTANNVVVSVPRWGCHRRGCKPHTTAAGGGCSPRCGGAPRRGPRITATPVTAPGRGPA
jgi:alpha-tubulin suppressor-like RCC1 family protein